MSLQYDYYLMQRETYEMIRMLDAGLPDTQEHIVIRSDGAPMAGLYPSVMRALNDTQCMRAFSLFILFWSQEDTFMCNAPYTMRMTHKAGQVNLQIPDPENHRWKTIYLTEYTTDEQSDYYVEGRIEWRKRLLSTMEGIVKIVAEDRS
jgi:hypothetical protein